MIHPIPAAAILELFEVSISQTMVTLGLCDDLWALWRRGLRRPSQQTLWGLTLLAERSIEQAAQTPSHSISFAASTQLRLTIDYAKKLLELQAQLNLSLSPAAKAAAERRVGALRLRSRDTPTDCRNTRQNEEALAESVCA